MSLHILYFQINAILIKFEDTIWLLVNRLFLTIKLYPLKSSK